MFSCILHCLRRTDAQNSLLLADAAEDGVVGLLVGAAALPRADQLVQGRRAKHSRGSANASRVPRLKTTGTL